MTRRRTPPRYVPTLTEVVRPDTKPSERAVKSDTDLAAESTGALAQEQLIERIMRRVDLSLERRLREAVAAAVIEQTRSIGELLRDEIEAVVRQTVAEAFEQELPPGR